MNAMKILFAVLAFFCSTAHAQKACLKTPGAMWDTTKPVGERCVCPKGLTHIFPPNICSACEERCVRQEITNPAPVAAVKPVDSKSKPVSAKSAEAKPPTPAPSVTALSAPAPVEPKCHGWKLPTERVQGWTDDLACACATSCKSTGKLGKNPLAKWDPDDPDGIFCRSLDLDHYESGVCALVPKPGTPGLPGMSGQPGEPCSVVPLPPNFDDLCPHGGSKIICKDSFAYACNGAPGAPGKDGVGGTTSAPGTAGTAGKNGLNCWDLNGNGLLDPSEDTNADGLVSALDCRGEKGERGDKGDKGDPSEAVSRQQRCEDHGGTWLDSTESCQCPPGFVTAKNGVGCLAQVAVSVKRDFLDVLHLHPEAASYVGGFYAANGRTHVPFFAGAGVGGAFDLVDEKLQLVLFGGVVGNGGDRPVGTFVKGGLRFWPIPNLGINLAAHGHFLGTNRRLSNQVAEVGGDIGPVVRWRFAKRFTILLEGSLLLGKAFPTEEFVVGGIGRAGFNF